MTNKPHAYITIGASASGKTTWANEQVERYPWIVNINRDDIRLNILLEKGKSANPNVFWDNWYKIKGGEALVTKIAEMKLDTAISNKCDIIISDTNLNESRVNNLRNRLHSAGYDVVIKLFDATYQELVKRDARRERPVGALVIGKQLDALHKLDFWKDYSTMYQSHHTDTNEPNVINLNKDKFSKSNRVILVDLDGTLAHMTDRTAFDETLVGSDTFDEIVWGAVIGVADRCKADIIFVSGRTAGCKQETIEWLTKHIGKGYMSLYVRDLHMRAVGDMRCDTIVKRRMIENIQANSEIIAVFDDRPKVARMYRSIGLKVFQLGNPYLEF